MEGYLSQLNRLRFLQVVVTRLAPVVLVVPANVVVSIAPNPLRPTVDAIAVEDRWLEQKLLASTQAACIAVPSLHLFLCLQSLHQPGVIPDELLLELVGHVPDHRPFGIVQHGIIESQVDISLDVL